MTDVERHQLLGRYQTPRFRYGDIVVCEIQGEVTIVGLTDARIPWPLGKRQGSRTRPLLVVYAGLAEAIRRESVSALSFWWGISDQTVTKWRHLMGVPAMTEGTTRLKVRSAEDSESLAAARERGRRTGTRRTKEDFGGVTGKPRLDHVVEVMRKARTEKP